MIDEKIYWSKEFFDSVILYLEISVFILEVIVVFESMNFGFVRFFLYLYSMYLNELKYECLYFELMKMVMNEILEYVNVESEYEDFDKYRKDLKKFLGMSDKYLDEVFLSFFERLFSLFLFWRVIKDIKKKRVLFIVFGYNWFLFSFDLEDVEYEVMVLVFWFIK